MHRSIFLVITVVVAASGVLSQTPNISDPAVALFKQGRFAEAERLVDPLLKKHKSDFDSILLKGRIALFSNKLSDAEKWLTKAKELRPDSKETLAALAEVYYRRNELAKAGALLRQAGRDSIAKKLESFADQKAYEIEAKRDVTEVKFVQTDPLPLIKVKINDGEEVFFLIDTGGGEVIVDSEFATKNNITSFGTEQGTFGGGRQSAVQQGRIDSISLGDFRVKNLPVNILDTKRFAAVAGGRRVDGIIGTILLSRFLSTLDYPGAKLVLRKNTEANSKTLAKNKSVSIPFWMAGDHYLVAWGTVNQLPTLMFIDTGLAGMGFAAPESTITEAKIQIQKGNELDGVGGGGRVRVTPFVAESITLGPLEQKNVTGVAGAFPPALENSLGFRIGGLLSHTFFRTYQITLDFGRMTMVAHK